MTRDNPPIVVVAYDRPKSLSRLLRSLAVANYTIDSVELIISIDYKSTNQDVLEIAKNFEWQFGKKTITYQKENLGLKKHIIQCGNLSQKYGSIVVLEDDLYVSPNFYQYALKALEFSKNKDYISGISLYNHQLNVHTRENFSPFEDGYSNWYFQLASSWGQAWSKKQWQGFMSWYEQKQIFPVSNLIPFNVSNWSEKSWLKYFVAYLIETNKYFLYPKLSFSTNFSDSGTHVGKDSTTFQVPLDYSKTLELKFSTLTESKSVYDAFFENLQLNKVLGLKESLLVDLYGYKNSSSLRYWLTTKHEKFKILKSFGRSLKPIDANIIEDIAGDDIFLYDTKTKTNNSFKNDLDRKIIYNIKHISLNNSYYILRVLVRNKILRAHKRIFKK